MRSVSSERKKRWPLTVASNASLQYLQHLSKQSVYMQSSPQRQENFVKEADSPDSLQADRSMAMNKASGAVTAVNYPNEWG